jgi:hypothetical protein
LYYSERPGLSGWDSVLPLTFRTLKLMCVSFPARFVTADRAFLLNSQPNEIPSDTQLGGNIWKRLSIKTRQIGK